VSEKLKKLVADAEAKNTELKAILDKGDSITQEDVANASTIRDALKTITEDIKSCKTVEGLHADFKAVDGFINDPSTKVPVGSGFIGLTRNPNDVTTVEGNNVYQTGAGVLSDNQVKTLRSAEYKNAFTNYLRRGVSKLNSDEVKVLQEGIDDQGGFLVPEQILATLISKKPAPTRVVNNVTKLQTMRDSLLMPKVVYATDDIYTSGIRVTWTGEVPASATVHRVTEPKFGTFRVNVFTAMLSCPLTVNMLEDAALNVDAYIADKFRETIDLLYDNMILNGTGVGQPSGILQNPNGTDEPATVNTGDANLLTADGLVDLGFAVPEQYDSNCRFVFNKTSTSKAVRKLKDGDGRYLFGMGMQDSGLSVTLRPPDLLGYPYDWSAFMPDVAASAYPIIFGDLTGYYMVERIGFSIQILRELYAETNQVVALGRIRFGGDVAEPWKMKIQKVSA